MTDQVVGYLLLGLAAVAAGAVVAVAARAPRAEPLHPPLGVHVPPGSWLPLAWAAGAALLGAGLAFKPEDQFAAWWFLLPGLAVIVVAAVLSIRAAGREWHETEHGSNDEGTGHH
jgi:hypothetical protein